MEIMLYSRLECSYADIVEYNFARKNLKYKKLILNEDFHIDEIEKITGKHIYDITFPVAVIDGTLVIGAKNIHAYIKTETQKS